MQPRRTTLQRAPSLVSALALGLALAGCSLLSSTTPTPGPSASRSASPLAAESPPPSPTASPTPPPAAPTATPVAVIPTCNPAHLAARITAWDAGAGHRTAHVEVTNTAGTTCHMRKLDRPQLVDGPGSVLIDGAPPAGSTYVTITPGGVLKTLVDDSNYCGPAPLAPVTVAFVFPTGLSRFVATPLSPTDLSGVPPCLGAPGSAGTITMQAWAP